MADGKTKLWFPKAGKALAKAVELLNGTDNTVRVNFAGEKAGGGVGFPNGLDGSKRMVRTMSDSKNCSFKKRRTSGIGRQSSS